MVGLITLRASNRFIAFDCFGFLHLRVGIPPNAFIEDIAPVEELACLFGDMVELVGEVPTGTLPSGELGGFNDTCVSEHLEMLSNCTPG